MHDSRERGENENYRCFLHMFFVVLIGQLGQIFVTYLTKGDRANPTWVKTVGSLACNAPGSQGLVEIALEQEIFGNQIKFMIRPELEYRDGQVSCEESLRSRKTLVACLLIYTIVCDGLFIPLG